MEFSVKTIDNLDKSSLNWTYDRLDNMLPPVAVEVNNIIYQITNFSSNSKNYLFAKLNSIQEAINFSVTFYNNINYVELSNIINIIEKYNLTSDDFQIFNEYNIKGNKNISVVKNIANLPLNIKKFIVKKEVPLKIVSLLTSFSDNVLKFIDDKLTIDKEPSVSDFIKFVNNTADNKDIIENTTYSKDFIFPEKISDIRKEFNILIEDLNKNISPVKIINSDFFEKGKIDFTFSTSSIDEINSITEVLKSNIDNINRLFIKMKENDIC